MRTGSHLNAFFKGKQEEEFTWFALGATLPGASMDAERAARQIVQAAKRGEAERVLSMPANLAVRFHGVFPGLTADILGLINRFILPEPTSRPTGAARGLDVEQRMSSSVLDTLTTLGRSAAERFHEYRGR
jgi:hypothetical protein